MKLKNKKTGEIMEFDAILPVKDVSGDSVAHLEYDSLAELNEEWEDYEEQKEYWFINDLDGEPMKCELRYCSVRDFDDWSEKRKKIGNYFSTKEEAQKAVERLRAWKRLKDKGFRFSQHSFLDRKISYKVPVADEKIGKDLDLLFGGEE